MKLPCLLLLSIVSLALNFSEAVASCEDLFAGASRLTQAGLEPETIRGIWNRGEKERRYLEAGAKITSLLLSAPKNFYRLVGMFASFAKLRRIAVGHVNPLARALKISEIEARWHLTGLDIASELMRKLNPDWYNSVLKNPTVEFKDLLSYTLLWIPAVNPALLNGTPTPKQAETALEIMMRQQGFYTGRIQSLIEHSRNLRHALATDLGNTLYEQHHQRAATPSELHTLRLLLDHIVDNTTRAPQVPSEQKAIADNFVSQFKLSRQNKYPNIGFEEIFSVMVDLKHQFIREKGLPIYPGLQLITEPHALTQNLLEFLEEDQIGGPDQLFFQFSCVMTQIIPASWPARTEVEAQMLKRLTDQLQSL